MESISVSDFITNSQLTLWQFKRQPVWSSLRQRDSWQEKHILKHQSYFLFEQVSEYKSRLVFPKNDPGYAWKVLQFLLLELSLWFMYWTFIIIKENYWMCMHGLIKERGRVNGPACWPYGLFKRAFTRKRKSFDASSTNDSSNKLRIMNYSSYHHPES